MRFIVLPKEQKKSVEYSSEADAVDVATAASKSFKQDYLVAVIIGEVVLPEPPPRPDPVYNAEAKIIQRW